MVLIFFLKYKVVEWFNKYSYFFVVYRNFDLQIDINMKVKDEKRDLNRNKVDVIIFVFDEIDFKIKLFRKDNEGYFILIQGIVN